MHPAPFAQRSGCLSRHCRLQQSRHRRTFDKQPYGAPAQEDGRGWSITKPLVSGLHRGWRHAFAAHRQGGVPFMAGADTGRFVSCPSLTLTRTASMNTTWNTPGSSARPGRRARCLILCPAEVVAAPTLADPHKPSREPYGFAHDQYLPSGKVLTCLSNFGFLSAGGHPSKRPALPRHPRGDPPKPGENQGHEEKNVPMNAAFHGEAHPGCFGAGPKVRCHGDYEIPIGSLSVLWNPDGLAENWLPSHQVTTFSNP